MASPKGSYYGRFQQWTAAENDLVRDLYTRTPRRALRATLTAALPHRSWSAIVAHAAVLDVPRLGCAWSPGEESTLRMHWGSETPGQILARLPGRPWRSVMRRAEALGLDVIPVGFVTLSEAARQLGYARGTLLKIVRAAEVPTMRWWGATATGPAKHGDGRAHSGRICRWLLVDLTLATIAVEESLARDGETVRGGAIARGVDPAALRRRLLRSGAFKVGQRGVRVLLPAAVLDAAVAELRAAA